ncbi:hypothetical protein KEM55_001824 [Ascosphaera atra]|nr:hypothetical protein KEM55_001824 [Ascosphaera atra]
MAERILMKELKALQNEKWAHVQLCEDDIFRWQIALMVLNPDSIYHGGYFKGIMTFPQNYPFSPPQFRFVRPVFHPNIYNDGRLCISILHYPTNGDDGDMSHEKASERWSPAQRVESVLVSILSLLDDAETSSPANVDASILLRRNEEDYRKRVRRDVEASWRDIPEGFVMPTAADKDLYGQQQEKRELIVGDDGDDEDFWAESGDDSSMFAGSDSEAEMEYVTDEEEERKEKEEEKR